MWKFGRSIVFPRWHINRQQTEKNDIISSQVLSNAIKAENLHFKNKNHKNEKSDDEKGFRRFPEFQDVLLRTRLFETAGWLATASVLCFNLHQKHFSSFGYKNLMHQCLFSQYVLAMPKVPPADKKIHLDTFFSLTETPDDTKINAKKISSTKISIEEMKKECLKCRTLYENSAGVSCVKKNNREAFRYFQSAARHGSTKAYYNLGLCYEQGIGTKINLTRAAFCYRRAASKGHGLASFNLAVYFLKGLGGLPVDQQAAKLLIETAAEQNVSEAQLYIGLEYLENEKWSDAYEIFRKLSEKEFIDAKYYLSICYENGWGITKNEKAATEILSQTAALGHAKSILRLSKYYEDGLGGCSPDLEFATALCQIVLEKGDEEAKEVILRLKAKKDGIKKMTANSTKKAAELNESTSSMHPSTSVPELSVEKTTKRHFLHKPVISAYLGLITPTQARLAPKAKTSFYVGEENLKFTFNTYVPSLQPVMTATS